MEKHRFWENSQKVWAEETEEEGDSTEQTW